MRLAHYTRSRYKPGQKWRCKARAYEPNACFIVGRVHVDAETGEIIVHVRLKNVKIKNPFHPQGLMRTIDHLPFSAYALDQSALELIDTDVPMPMPFNWRGYQHWMEAYEEGKGGFFSVPIREALNGFEQRMVPREDL